MGKLISYAGRTPVEVDFGMAEKRAHSAGKPFVRETKGGTLYLRPGTTASLSDDEYEALIAAAPAALRFVFVHPSPVAAPDLPEVKADLGGPGEVSSGASAPDGTEVPELPKAPAFRPKGKKG